MIISVGKSRRDTRWRNMDVTWDALVERLSGVVRTHETMREYRAMDKEEQGRLKDIGGFVGGRIEGGRRKNDAVVDRCLVTLDADNATPGLLKDTMLLFPYEMAVYSTHSHTEESPRLRFVIPLGRVVTPDEYEPIARKLAEYIDINSMDPSTYEASRLMYWPSCPSDAVPVFEHLVGQWANPDEILREYGLDDAWKDSRLWPIAKTEQEVRVREARRQGDPLEKHNEVGLFCRAYSIEDAMDELIPGVYEPCGEGRYTYVAGSTAGGAVLYDDGKFLYSHHGTDPCGGQLVNAFDMVRLHKFGELDGDKGYDDVVKSPSYQAMSEFASGLPKVKRQLASERMGLLDDIVDAGDGEDSEVEGEDWRDQLDTKGNKYLPTRKNLRLILENDPRLKDCLRFNEFLQAPVHLRPCPWRPDAVMPKGSEVSGVLWQDADDAGLAEFMESEWGINDRGKLQDSVTLASLRQSFHPVRDFLDSCAKEWDGVERVDNMLIDHLGATGDLDYIRAVTRTWMIGAVKRIYEPGCQFDNMLVLTGPEGSGKSRFGRILSRGWFTDSLSRMDNSKDSFEGIEGSWIVEIAELAAASSHFTSLEAVKNFITKEKDKYRKAYGRRPGEYLRQCVFYGTTNEDGFLRDPSGDRRFWPVRVQRIDRGRLTGLTDDVVRQLWGEAVMAYRGGELCMLDDEMDMRAAAVREDYRVQDQNQGEVEMYLDTLLPDGWYEMSKEDRRGFFEGYYSVGKDRCTLRRDRVCVAEIRWELYGKGAATSRYGDTLTFDILRALKRLGWERGHQGRSVYGRQMMYWRPGREGANA